MKKLVLLSAALLLAMSSAFAENNLKIGVVDVQRIIQQAPETDKINAKLSKEFKPRQEQLIKANKDLQATTNKFNRDSAVLSAQEKEKLQDKIMNDRRNLAEQAQVYQNDLNTERSKNMQDLIKHIQTAIDKVAAKEKFDLILEKQAAPFTTTTLEVTDQVLQQLKQDKA